MAKPIEGTSEPFKCKTCVLRVSIHCEGCKRKVIKILHNINGVHAIEIDRKQQKVTVTTNTDEQTLIKRLIKAGKHAEPWPEIKPISKNIKQKQIAVEIPAGETSAAVRDGGKQKQSTETEPPPPEELQVPSKNEEKCGINENVQVVEISKGGDATETGGGGGPAERVVESPPSIAGETEPGVPSVAVDVQASCGGGVEGRKKKKKKSQRKEKSGGAVAGEAASPQTIPTPASIGSATLDHNPDQIPSSNHSPPLNQPYNYSVHTVVSQPAYIASYNTVYPSNTYGAYYTSPPPYSYAYVHSAAPRSISPLSSPSSIVEQSYPHVHFVASRNISLLSSRSPEVEQLNSPTSSPFDFFSDENPSGCSIM